jgi:hypothetical protein
VTRLESLREAILIRMARNGKDLETMRRVADPVTLAAAEKAGEAFAAAVAEIEEKGKQP